MSESEPENGTTTDADATLTHSTGEDPIPVGEEFTDQEDAAESTKDADSVKAVADPTGEGGLPDWPTEDTPWIKGPKENDNDEGGDTGQ